MSEPSSDSDRRRISLDDTSGGSRCDDESSREIRTRHLADAVEAYVEHCDRNEADPDKTVFSGDEEVQDLLSIMLHPPPPHAEATNPTAENTSLELDKLGDFRLLREIGRGGMGVVYLAEQISLGRMVALKILPKQLNLSPRRVERFQWEAVAAARLRHPNVVPVYSVGEEEGFHFFAMEYVTGQSLADLIAKMRTLPRTEGSEVLARLGAGTSGESVGPPSGAIPVRGQSYVAVAAGIGYRVAIALSYAHGKGIIHRDIKPSNILVSELGTPMVVDFGLAKEEGSRGLSMTGDTLGTPHYMSPEQIKTGKVTPRSDIFSLGVSLYELLTLERPFKGNSVQEVFRQITSVEPKPIRKLNPQIARDLETIVLHAMENKPENRYPSAADMASDLLRFLELRPIQARPIGFLERMLRVVRRHRAASMAAALAFLLVVGGPLFYTFQQKAARRSVESQKSIADAQRKVAERERDEKRRARLRASGLLLSSQSRTLLSEDPGLSLLLAIEGFKKAPGLVAKEALYRAWEESFGAGHEERTLVGHRGEIYFACFSPDGGSVLTVSEDKSARIWDATTGETRSILEGHRGPVRGAAFSPDGTLVATRSRDCTARIWTVSTGEERALLRHRDRVTSLDFDPLGEFLVTASRDGAVTQFASSGEFVTTLAELGGLVLDVAFNPDGDRIAVAVGDGTVRILDGKSGELVVAPMSHLDLVTSIAFSPDGERLVSTSRDGTARIWRTQDGASESVLRGKSQHGEVSHATFDPTGRRVLTAGADGVARVWDVESGRCLCVMEGHTGWLLHAAFSPDGRYVLTCSWDGTAMVWSSEDGEELARLKGHGDRVRHGTFSPDGTRVVTAGHDGTARIWNIEFDKDRPYHLRGHRQAVVSARFSPDRRHVFTASLDGTAFVWELESGRKVGELRGHRAGVTAIDFSFDGRLVLTASLDGTVRLWDAEDREPVRVLTVGSSVDMAVFSPDGRSVLTVSRRSGSARILNTETGEVDLEIPHRFGTLWCADFSPDGRKVVTTEDGMAHLWDASTGERLSTIKGHHQWIKWVEFDRDGTRVVTVSPDGTASVWNVDGKEDFRTKPALVLRGHKLALESAVFSADGRFLVTASEDRTARIWDAKTGAELARLGGHEAGVMFATFDSDDRWVVTVSRDRTARLWPVDPLESAIARKPRDLTWEEEDRFSIWPEENRKERIGRAEARRRAKTVVDSLFRELVLIEDVVAYLRDDTTLLEPVKEEALRNVETRWDDPDWINNESWTLVKPCAPVDPDLQKRALRWATAACRITPRNNSYLHTLGVCPGVWPFW